ncbi:MAG: ribosome silencing factor [Gammaproteobacteria bacterium]|nr:ribosome silencing factor [Gammaproteobacteria bacterium]
MQTKQLTELVEEALADLKAKDMQVLDVRDACNVTDVLVIATGTSTRHVKALANNIVVKAKENNIMPYGTEGEQTGDWVLVDLGDVVAHVLTQEMRDFYQLERLWSAPAASGKTANG